MQTQREVIKTQNLSPRPSAEARSNDCLWRTRRSCCGVRLSMPSSKEGDQISWFTTLIFYPSLIFVHGLRGDITRTWSTAGKQRYHILYITTWLWYSAILIETFWPRDLLGKDLQNIRIISWGYDSDVMKMFSSSSQDTIVGHAETLLTDIDSLRFESEVRSSSYYKLADHFDSL